MEELSTQSQSPPGELEGMSHMPTSEAKNGVLEIPPVVGQAYPPAHESLY